MPENFQTIYLDFIDIRIKSLGASHKKPPDVCLDQCIEYSERVREDESGTIQKLFASDCAAVLQICRDSSRDIDIVRTFQDIV